MWTCTILLTECYNICEQPKTYPSSAKRNSVLQQKQVPHSSVVWQFFGFGVAIWVAVTATAQTILYHWKFIVACRQNIYQRKIIHKWLLEVWMSRCKNPYILYAIILCHNDYTCMPNWWWASICIINILAVSHKWIKQSQTDVTRRYYETARVRDTIILLFHSIYFRHNSQMHTYCYLWHTLSA